MVFIGSDAERPDQRPRAGRDRSGRGVIAGFAAAHGDHRRIHNKSLVSGNEKLDFAALNGCASASRLAQ